MQNQKRDIKILVSADIKGRFQQVMPKVSQLHSKNHFDIMLLLGEVCHIRSSSYINSIIKGQQSFPFPIYFIDNSQFVPVLCRIHPKGAQIVQNFNFLGNYGVIQILGLNIAYFGSNKDWQNSQPSNTEVESFLQLCRQKHIDILMTNEWSNEIKVISQKSNPKTADYISRIAEKLNPRYHLAASSDSFFRMSPYKNSKGSQTHFICVAPCQEQLKDKYLFALTIKPNHIDLIQGDSNCLENPYANLNQEQNQEAPSFKQKLKHLAPKKSDISGQIIVHFDGFPEWARKEDISEFLQRWGELKHLECYKDKRGGQSGTVRFVSNVNTQRCLADSGKFMFHSKRIKFLARGLSERQRVEDCWFCKVNSDRSLVVWQGRYLYVSLQKGPLCRFHMQIIPYNHTESSGKLDLQQRQQFSYVLNGLTKHFKGQGYQVIRYQRCLPLSQAINHCVVHLLPVKTSKLLTASFEKLNKEDGLNFREWSGDRRNSQYFLEMQIGGKLYLKEVQRREKIQADFMRQLLCQLFDTPKLVNWKSCERNSQQLSSEKVAFSVELARAGLSS